MYNIPHHLGFAFSVSSNQMYVNLFTLGVVSAKRNSFQNYKQFLSYIYSGARKQSRQAWILFQKAAIFHPLIETSQVSNLSTIQRNSAWKQAACHALEAGSSLRGLSPAWAKLPQCFYPEWALFWDQEKDLPCSEGKFNILSDFSAIFLCRHSQHNFYSGLNKRKAEALLERHSAVTVQNI